MTEFFNESYLIKAQQQRKKCLLFYIIVAAIFAILSVVTVYVYAIQPFGSNKNLIIKIIAWFSSAIFIVFSFLYLGIKFKLINDYYKMCLNLKTGLKETSNAHYVGENLEVCTKDGVECISLVFLEWNKYKKEYYERRVYVPKEWDMPKIKENSDVEFVTQGNVLISYEIKEEQIEEKGE